MISSRVARGSRHLFAGWVAASSLLIGCATAGNQAAVREEAEKARVVARSPNAMELAPSEAWRRAEALVASRRDRDVLIGRGDSMRPLYPDRTVLVVERMAMSSFLPGMTVVFVGYSGFPVAHVLSHRTSTGWVARGMANGEADRARVRSGNYLGTVVAAFIPNPAMGERAGMAAVGLGDSRTATISVVSRTERPDTVYFASPRTAGQ